MKGIREIKGRIKAIKSTEKITRAMQLVAASKMKRAQDKARASRSYALLLAEVLGSLLEKSDSIEHPLFDKRPVKHRGVLVISTDKGLCGPLNSNLFRLVGEMEESTRFVAIGRKAAQFLSRNKRDLAAEFTVSDNCTFAEVRPAVEYLINAYKNCEVDTLEVVFPRFVNTLTQETEHETLLPLQDLPTELEALHKRLELDENDKRIEDDRQMLFEPDAPTIMERLPQMYARQEIYQMILEAKASEHSARMVAMKSATDNAKELNESLSLEYNKARQAAITQEILELAASNAA